MRALCLPWPHHESLTYLKDSLSCRCMHNIPRHTLLSIVEHAILRFRMVARNGEQYIRHVWSIWNTNCETLYYILYKTIIENLAVFETICARVRVWDLNEISVFSQSHSPIFNKCRCTAFATRCMQILVPCASIRYWIWWDQRFTSK